MFTRSVSREIEAPAEQLWRMVADVTRIGEWSPESTSAEWLDGATGPAVGARFKGHNKNKSSWSSTCEVIAADPGKEFAFVVGKPSKPATTWRYVLTPRGASRTEVTESFELPRPLGFGARLSYRLTAGVKDRTADLEQNMRTTLDNLAVKAAAEATAS